MCLLWPNQQHCYGGVDIKWGITQFWREIVCMEVATWLSGAKGNKAHKLYKEEDSSDICYVLDYYFVCGLFRLLAFFSYLVDFVVLFSTGCSRAGIPSLSLRGLLEEHCTSSPHSGLRPSYNFLHQHNFYRILCCVAGCSSGGSFWVSFELVLQWRKASIHWKAC